MQSKDPYTQLKAGSRGRVSPTYDTKSQRPRAIAAHRGPSIPSAHSQANGQNSAQDDAKKVSEGKISRRTERSCSRRTPIPSSKPGRAGAFQLRTDTKSSDRERLQLIEVLRFRLPIRKRMGRTPLRMTLRKFRKRRFHTAPKVHAVEGPLKSAIRRARSGNPSSTARPRNIAGRPALYFSTRIKSPLEALTATRSL